MEKILTEVFGIWYLIGAAFVFFMQAGFAMVEAGFTRAKNAGNIIMKNLMDFCLGTVAFLIVGYSFLCGSDVANGFIGWVGFGNGPLTNFASTDWSSFVFNLVFCATAATIVSGAMAERTKFLSYCIYSFVISLIVYPIEAHWVWGPDGWLTAMGFHDFAGSAVIHFVGGLTALIGAKILGPRIGKFNKDGSPNGIPGHSLTIGALGVFILWFGWYGFNGAAANEYNFGVKIDGYVVTDFEMFKVLVDSLGGVNVDVTEKEAKEVTNHPKRYGNVTLEAGDNKLTGEQALAYCRIRKIDTDFVRTQRQRTVMSAILKKALTNPFKLYKMAYNSAPYIETDLSKGELMGLVSKAGTCVANIHQTSIPFDGTWDYATIWGNSVIKINTEKNKDKLIDYIYNLSSADIKAQEKEDK